MSLQLLTQVLKAQSLLKSSLAQLQTQQSEGMQLLQDVPQCAVTVLTQEPYMSAFAGLQKCDTLPMSENGNMSALCTANRADVDACFGSFSTLFSSGFFEAMANACANDPSADISVLRDMLKAMSCMGNFMQDIMTTTFDLMCTKDTSGAFCFDQQETLLAGVLAPSGNDLLSGLQSLSQVCDECVPVIIKASAAMLESASGVAQCLSDTTGGPSSGGVTVVPPQVDVQLLRKLALGTDALCGSGCLDKVNDALLASNGEFDFFNAGCSEPCVADTLAALESIFELGALPVGARRAMALMCQKDGQQTCWEVLEQSMPRLLQEQSIPEEPSCCVKNIEVAQQQGNATFADVCQPLYQTAKRVAGRLVLQNIKKEYLDKHVDELRGIVSAVLGAPIEDVQIKVEVQHGLVTIVFDIRTANDELATKYLAELQGELPEVKAFAQFAPQHAREDPTAAASIDLQLTSGVSCENDADCKEAQKVPDQTNSAVTMSSVYAAAAAAAVAALRA